MKWTTERPTVEGWYWWIADQVPHNTFLPTIVFVTHHLTIRSLTLRANDATVDELGGRFAGPIPPPEE